MIEGRIIKGVGGLYTVATGSGELNCGVRGVFRKDGFIPLVGDFVSVELSGERGTITRFKERRTELTRPRVANVDQAVITFAAKRPNVNRDMLDRFLLLAEERGLDIVICINKSDLTQTGEIDRVYGGIGYRVLSVSAKTGGGLEELRAELRQKVSVFAGPSGVGKSSLVNSLLSREKMATGELSRKIDRGKHTTRHAELIELPGGAYVVDTPGFTTLELGHIPGEKLPGLFREFRAFQDKCRFGDCKHIKEPDCAVKEAVGDAIDPSRYERYVKIMNEKG